MKAVLKLLCFSCFILLVTSPMIGQAPSGIMKTEAGTPEGATPLDDIVEKRITNDKEILQYETLREADILWEKRVWRVIDTREKMNLAFVFPDHELARILLDAAINGDITVYKDEKFTEPMFPEEVASIGASKDTSVIIDPETLKEELVITSTDIDLSVDGERDQVSRFRIKEVWFFDEESSRMFVRILGIAPVFDELDETTGNVLFTYPLFWVYYPEARYILAREQVYTNGNDAANLTWDDLFERRYFSSYIYKASNVRDERIQDYIPNPLDQLLEADKIKMEIFNFEHDLWSY